MEKMRTGIAASEWEKGTGEDGEATTKLDRDVAYKTSMERHGSESCKHSEFVM